MKKLIPVVAISGLLFVIGFISTSVRNNNITFAAPPCKSCIKAADSSKKQSSSKKICSAITGILKNEIGKTKNKTKLDILKGGLDYANDVCDSGGSPDLAKITKGLPEKEKARISQKTNAALFDGAADRPDKDFAPDTSKTAATLTGTGGQVADLKSAEPATPKLNTTSEFSLVKPSTLLASTRTAALVQKAKAAPVSDIDPTYVGGWCCNGVFMEASSAEEKNNKCCKAFTQCCMPGDGTGTDILDRIKAFINRFWKWIKSLFDKEDAEEEAQRKIDEWKERSKYLPTAFTVCNGKGGFKPQLNKYADAPCGVAGCVGTHEETHIKDFKNSEKYKNWCVAPDGTNKPDGTIVEINDEPFYRETQCKAFTADAACLDSKRAQTSTSACRTFLTEEFQKSIEGRLLYCQW